jgi:outer membrane protein OmpA-like peptidoglycan-associated protein
MKAKRAALLGLFVCLLGANASAQIAPNSQGDIGLFTMPSAYTPRAGAWTFGLYGWKEQLVAGNLAFENTDTRSRLYVHWAGEGSLGIGLTDHWSIFGSAGEERFENRGGWTGGSINSIQIHGNFIADEARKIRLGTKYGFTSEADPDFRVAGWLAAHIPIGQSSITKGESDADLDKIKSRRTDWEWGFAATKGILTGIVSYQLSGKHDNDIRVANRLRFGAGVDWPVAPAVHVMAELDRTIMDGGDFPEENYSMLTLGGRFFIGHSGWAVTAGLNSNMDMMVKHGFSPSPIGGIVGFTYAAWPPAPPPPVVVPPPPPAPVAEPVVEAPPPKPAPQPPPPPAPKTTRDEIYFDAGSARLTNIAKAVLDGVALRMKNDLNSTAVITGYSDNSGSEEANLAISAKRAAAAKEYLVTRHGIDPARITTAGKGSAEPEYDNSTAEGKAKNRRALIVVTLVSGS